VGKVQGRKVQGRKVQGRKVQLVRQLQPGAFQCGPSWPQAVVKGQVLQYLVVAILYLFRRLIHDAEEPHFSR